MELKYNLTREFFPVLDWLMFPSEARNPAQ